MSYYQIPSDYYTSVAGIESGNNPYATAGTSSASGLFQFVRGTWEGLGFDWGDRFDTGKQNQAMKMFTQQNAGVLSQAGVQLSDESLYAAHFLGAGTAASVLSSPLGTPISSVVGPQAINANPSILGGGKTVGDFWDWLREKFGSKPAPANPGYSEHVEGVGDVSNLPVISGWDIANPFKGSLDTSTGSWSDPFGVIKASDNLVDGIQDTIANAASSIMSVLTEGLIRGGYIFMGFVLIIFGLIVITKTGPDFVEGIKEGVRDASEE